MDYRTVKTAKGDVSEAVLSPGESLSDYSTFFDALMGAPTSTVAVAREHIRESNRTGQVVFVKTLEEAVGLLR